MVFFITTSSVCSVEELIKAPIYSHGSEKTEEIKAKNVRAYFRGCQKLELESHIVFIYGKAFPPRGHDLKSCLEKLVKKGTGCELLNGNFNIIVFDKRDFQFSIYGDTYGSLPVFFSEREGVVRVSSFFELLLQDTRDYRLRESSLLDYLCLGYVLPGESLWESVELLPRGKYLKVNTLKQSVLLKELLFKKSQPFYYSSLKQAGEDFIERIKEVLEDEFNFLDVSQLDLTGGADTRILMSCMSPAQLKRLNYRTFESAFWDDTNYDMILAKQLAQKFNLNHFTVENYAIHQPDFFHLSYSSIRDQKNKATKSISGMFGSELFGGALLAVDSLLDYRFSERIDKIKDSLFQSLITLSDYKRIGSPWDKLQHRIIYSENPFKEQDLAQQILLRSPWTSVYSKYNVSAFVIPYYYIRSSRVCPYIDTRMIDFFLSCPREFFLNYILYEYVFTHLVDKKWTEIPFYSDMMKFVETFSKIKPEDIVVNDVSAKSACGYKLYFEKYFSASLFEGTFLEKADIKSVNKIPKDILFKICDLNGFMSDLSKDF